MGLSDKIILLEKTFHDSYREMSGVTDERSGRSRARDVFLANIGRAARLRLIREKAQYVKLEKKSLSHCCFALTNLIQPSSRHRPRWIVVNQLFRVVNPASTWSPVQRSRAITRTVVTRLTSITSRQIQSMTRRNPFPGHGIQSFVAIHCQFERVQSYSWCVISIDGPGQWSFYRSQMWRDTCIPV